MKIAFNVYGSGLGNNGGSRTVVRSANALTRLGHEVYVFSHCDNLYTWDKLIGGHIKSEKSFFPQVDIGIATACTTAHHTISMKPQIFKKAAYWIRGIELWSNPYDYLIKTYNLPFDLIMANSEWQVNLIQTLVFKKIVLQYPGLELDWFTPGTKKKDHIIQVGALFHPAKHKGPEELFKIISLSQDDITFKFLSANPIGEYKDVIINPSTIEKREYYRNCDIWLATTKLDGLHLPPMEAGLCGATLVANGRQSAGMSDHAFDGKTSLVYNELIEAAEGIHKLVENPELRKKLNSNHRALLKRKMDTREYQMNKMVSKFEKLF